MLRLSLSQNLRPARVAAQNPYAQVQLVNLVSSPEEGGGIKVSSSKSRRLGLGRTQTRGTCSNPVWHNYLELGCAAQPDMEGDDTLLIVVLDSETETASRPNEDTWVASARIPIQAVPADGTTRQFRLTRWHEGNTDPYPVCPQLTAAAAAGSSSHPVIISLRRLPTSTPTQPRMTLYHPHVTSITIRAQNSGLTEIYLRFATPILILETPSRYLVRHGESEWNQAKAAGHLYTMAKSYDHPLSALGVQQARQLRSSWAGAGPESADPDGAALPLCELSEEDAKHARQIQGAQRMYTSPLTRALQTAMIGFMGHPCAAESGAGISLVCSAREVKTLGGFDTVGIATGQSVLERACTQSEGHLADGELEALRSTKLDLREVASKWWTSVVDYDTSDTIGRRIRELLLRIRYDSCVSGDDGAEERRPSIAIVVAHSLIIREIIRRCTVPGSRFDATELAKELAVGKLENGGTIALDIGFFDQKLADEDRPRVAHGGDAARALARVEKATLLFGTKALIERSTVLQPQFVDIPLHAITRIDDSGGGVGFGLVSSYKLAVKHAARPAATYEDGSPRAVYDPSRVGGAFCLEFDHQAQRDSMMERLAEACRETQHQRFQVRVS
jgi:hypothetical protein